MSNIADLVYQTTTGTGTGNLTLSAVTGWRSFASAFSTGATTNVFRYAIRHQAAAEWEIGTGHMSDSTTLVRDTVIASSNSDAFVSLSAGTKDVVCDVNAATYTARSAQLLAACNAMAVRRPTSAFTNYANYYNIVPDFDGNYGHDCLLVATDQNEPFMLANGFMIPSGCTGLTLRAALRGEEYFATLDADPAVDLGSGMVAIPATGHGFSVGEWITISGTANYDGDYEVQDHAESGANVIVIEETYTAETFSTSDTVTAMYAGQTIVFKMQAIHAADEQQWSSEAINTMATLTLPSMGGVAISNQTVEGTVALSTLGLAAGDWVEAAVVIDTSSTWQHEVAVFAVEIWSSFA